MLSTTKLRIFSNIHQDAETEFGMWGGEGSSGIRVFPMILIGEPHNFLAGPGLYLALFWLHRRV